MSRLIFPVTADSVVPIATGITVAAFPPLAGTFGAVPASWGSAIPQFDLRVRGSTSQSLTGAELFAGQLSAYTTVAGAITSFDNATERATKVAHGLLTGDGPIQLTNVGGAPPTGLALLTNYWIIWVSSSVFKFASSFANALAGTAVAFSTDGTGTTTVADVATTSRMHLYSMGLLGPALDGTIAVTPARAYTARCDHNPLTVAYGFAATFGAAEAVSVDAVPIYEH